MKALLIVLVAAAAASFPARADSVAGWQVTTVPQDDGVCLARRDEGGKYLTLAFDKDEKNTLRIVFEFGNDAWTLEPRTALPAAMVVGQNVSGDNIRWVTISPTSLFSWSVKPDSMIADMKAADAVGIRFPDGKQQDTSVGLAGFAQALPALEACRSKMR